LRENSASDKMSPLAGRLHAMLDNAMIGHCLLPAASAQAPVQEELELQVMQETFGDDFAELAGLFQTDTLKRISALHKTIADTNLTETGRVAHALSGSAASLGATRLSALCKALELQTQTGLRGDMASLLMAIEEEYARLEAGLQAMLRPA
jgi:HPt (histidine-containing phosphotransfer) domain-containing protein